MSHTKPSAFNPCDGSVPKGEQPAAKVWELLRRNVEFRKAVDEVVKLDRRQRGKATQPVESLQDHPFAEIAIQWLFPKPLFMAWRKHKSDGSEEHGEGLSPNLSHPSWRWRSGQPEGQHTAGGHHYRGPVVAKRDGDRVDAFAEWKGWKPGKRFFDCDTPWPETHAGFRREFMRQWRDYDSRPVNLITKDRLDSPTVHEISLNGSGFRPLEYSVEQLAHQLKLDDLKSFYRIMALPRPRFVEDVKDLLHQAGIILKNGLPFKHEVLGAFQAWDCYLCFEAHCASGKARQQAYDGVLCDRHGKSAVAQGLKGQAARTVLWRNYGGKITLHVRDMEELIDGVFPRWNEQLMFQPNPASKASGK